MVYRRLLSNSSSHHVHRYSITLPHHRYSITLPHHRNSITLSNNEIVCYQVTKVSISTFDVLYAASTAPLNVPEPTV